MLGMRVGAMANWRQSHSCNCKVSVKIHVLLLGSCKYGVIVQGFYYDCRMCEVGRMDSTVVLKQATSACPGQAQLYYFAARLELSRTSAVSSGVSVDRAIHWLVRCVRDFYVEVSAVEALSTKRVLVLYRQVYHSLEVWPSCFSAYCLMYVNCHTV